MNATGLILVGVAIWYVMRQHAQQPIEVPVSGAPAKKVPHKFNPSGDWKIPYPVPTNLFGSHPYGWCGQPVNTYLQSMANDSALPAPVASASTYPPPVAMP